MIQTTFTSSDNLGNSTAGKNHFEYKENQHELNSICFRTATASTLLRTNTTRAVSSTTSTGILV